ncbi:von Willebrand factor D and EGF domain-containing protein [Culex quinquefasciatus]|uniref:von Willebrand factor D and EGF domain-containing protein n=1 Tax=Culex quinquefasciatus TaxID=7176 RepID=UPI0018E3E6ED|nr:von Willebrand factor D and EGF domain-containing protein [Culex quinquefasciatus]
MTTPYINSWDEYVSRYSTCSYECFFISHNKQVHFGYYTKSCELAYLTESRLVCCEGYFDYGGDCYPVCKSGCPNGRCTGPDQCTCNEGYVNVLNECKPKCSSCENGRCVAPNECVCDEGFRKDSNAACVPSCKDACIGGLCDRDGHCACSKEQFFNPKLLEFGVRNGTVCTGRCDKPCQNGYCVGRNRCQCLNGYQPSKVDPFACTPVFDPSYVDCTGGVCVAPNTCICKTGYTLISGKCVPVCDPECINGNCVSPGQCSCLSGYHKIQESDFECIPTCDPPCNNGKCVSPNTCECFHGFAGSLEVANRCEATSVFDRISANAGKDTNAWTTTPTAIQFVTQLRWIAPTSENNSRYCSPTCSQPCKNGICTAPNVCECHDGYNQTEFDEGCTPMCEESCENAICSAPNVCSCLEGFVPLNSTFVEHVLQL